MNQLDTQIGDRKTTSPISITVFTWKKEWAEIKSNWKQDTQSYVSCFLLIQTDRKKSICKENLYVMTMWQTSHLGDVPHGKHNSKNHKSR